MESAHGKQKTKCTVLQALDNLFCSLQNTFNIGSNRPDNAPLKSRTIKNKRAIISKKVLLESDAIDSWRQYGNLDKLIRILGALGIEASYKTFPTSNNYPNSPDMYQIYQEDKGTPLSKVLSSKEMYAVSPSQAPSTSTSSLAAVEEKATGLSIVMKKQLMRNLLINLRDLEIQGVIHTHLNLDCILISPSAQTSIVNLHHDVVALNLFAKSSKRRNEYDAPEATKTETLASAYQITSKSPIYSMGIIFAKLLLGSDINLRENPIEYIQNSTLTIEEKEFLVQMLHSDPSKRSGVKDLLKDDFLSLPREFSDIELKDISMLELRAEYDRRGHYYILIEKQIKRLNELKKAKEREQEGNQTIEKQAQGIQLSQSIEDKKVIRDETLTEKIKLISEINDLTAKLNALNKTLQEMKPHRTDKRMITV